MNKSVFNRSILGVAAVMVATLMISPFTKVFAGANGCNSKPCSVTEFGEKVSTTCNTYHNDYTGQDFCGCSYDGSSGGAQGTTYCDQN